MSDHDDDAHEAGEDPDDGVYEPAAGDGVPSDEAGGDAEERDGGPEPDPAAVHASQDDEVGTDRERGRDAGTPPDDAGGDGSSDGHPGEDTDDESGTDGVGGDGDDTGGGDGSDTEVEVEVPGTGSEGDDDDEPESGAGNTDAVAIDRADPEAAVDGEAPTAADLTPDDVEYDRPEEYTFDGFDEATLPPAVQYTPEYDDHWIFPSGAKAGGTRDDAPVQGLEIGVMGHEDALWETVEAVLDGLERYYGTVGEYPRHRVVADAESFAAHATDDGVGVVAAVQPRPDDHDGLVGHMQAMQADPIPATLTPNREGARRIARYLRAGIDAHPEVAVTDESLTAAVGDVWADGRPIGGTVIVQRYAPLAAGGMYGPENGSLEMDGPGVDDVSDLSFERRYVAVDDPTDLDPPVDDGAAGDEADTDEANEADTDEADEADADETSDAVEAESKPETDGDDTTVDGEVDGEADPDDDAGSAAAGGDATGSTDEGDPTGDGRGD